MYCVSLFLGYVLLFFLLLFLSFFNLPVGRCMEFVECKRVRKWRKKGRGGKGQTLMVRDVADLLHGNNSSGTTSPSRYRFFCTSEQQSRSMIRVYIEGRPNLLNLRAEYRENRRRHGYRRSQPRPRLSFSFFPRDSINVYLLITCPFNRIHFRMQLLKFPLHA